MIYMIVYIGCQRRPSVLRLKIPTSPTRFRKMARCLEGDPDKIATRNLENGTTIGYKNDIGRGADVSHVGGKRRVYGEAREFLGNYETFLGKENLPNAL